jgi:PleD family two-component response regulator
MPARWKRLALTASASAGVTSVGRLDTPAQVLARADAAMYRRKAERRVASRPSKR